MGSHALALEKLQAPGLGVGICLSDGAESRNAGGASLGLTRGIVEKHVRDG